MANVAAAMNTITMKNAAVTINTITMRAAAAITGIITVKRKRMSRKGGNCLRF